MTFATDPQTALQTSAVDPDISAAITLYNRLQPLQDALGLKTLTVAEMQLFAMVAHHTGLDPFTKQIYAVKRDGKVNHQTGIDGYRSVAESKGGGQYAGSDEASFEACDCGKDPEGHPKIARVVVHRILPNGHMVDQVGIARWHELYTGSAEQFMWKKMPFNQLAKCAEANGLRKAFPRILGGVYIDEEMQQAGPADDSPLVVAATQPTAAERIAARAAALRDVDEAVEGESREAEAPSVAAFPESGGCGWSLETRDGVLPCEGDEMHDGTHSWQEMAVKNGGKVLRPADA